MSQYEQNNHKDAKLNVSKIVARKDKNKYI